MKDVGEMLYRLLANGGEVTDQEFRYRMGEDGSLVIAIAKDEKEIWIKIDCDMSAFRAMAERIGREEIWLCLCALRLQGNSDG